MHPQIIARLNDINRQFYATTADDFDATRGSAWPGWSRLLDILPAPSAPVRVLDVGCGNGRFGVFLAEAWGAERVRYHGVDNNADLLRYAREALADRTSAATFTAQDVIAQPLDTPTAAYDLVVAFGLLHHVPGHANRREFVAGLARLVTAGGHLAFACWRFHEFERFRQRVINWPDDLADHVEAGDYLLDWRRGETAIRYCHHVDDDEQTGLVAASGLRPVAGYRADGFTGTVNAYSVLSV
ncbi:MAG: class I SAM-dependent methyltransferase [Anaerolineaceae bacterium]|nr:MAG: class I SAM-dependent methyltransferase [Anaerolineaceae bacterium]